MGILIFEPFGQWPSMAGCVLFIVTGSSTIFGRVGLIGVRRGGGDGSGVGSGLVGLVWDCVCGIDCLEGGW